MAGWSRTKRLSVEKAFYKFLDRSFVNSKDAGRICLGENLLLAQRMFITGVFDALEIDIHRIFVLKSRQLGISTISRAFSVFYLGIHDGLKGALVFDTSPHKDDARNELVTMIHDLPPSLKFPKVMGTGRGNRDSLTLNNDSRMLFLSAGVKKSKSSGTLGRSAGLTMAHCSELCSWDNDDGLKAFEQSLSEHHPDRLYIYESTARGFNAWHVLWEEARADINHCKCIFIGWWGHDRQQIPKSSNDFIIYGEAPPSDKELVRIRAVREQYGIEITLEQLAWIRRKVNPVPGDDFADSDSEDAVMLAEQAWTEQEAFQQTGAIFFGAKVLTDQTNNFVNNKYKKYMFFPGDDFVDMKVFEAQNQRSVELKVWEEPDVDATYVIAVDPAYGEDENNDRSSIQVLRCYADGIDQVAEYAWPLITARQLAWVLASLLGWYGYGRNECRYILELNGPGVAVFTELQNLKFRVDNDRTIRPKLDEMGLRNIFENVRTYIYTRADSMGAGYNWHFVTNTRLKITLMERLRDMVSTGKIHVRSLEVVKEMASIAREGDSIKAPGSMKDDRVLALAMGVHCWEAKCQRQLISGRRTREADAARKNLSIVDQVALFNQNHLDMFFKQRKMASIVQRRQLQRVNWRGRVN